MLSLWQQATELLAPICQGALTSSSMLKTIRVGGNALTDAERKDLIERSLAGEHIELEFDAVTYIQRETPNRNFIRFKPGALRTIAKSGVGSVYLVDHRQRESLARGGTVVASRAEKVGDEWHFIQTIRATKPWAVQAVLDGTADRFSIGWNPTGPIVYSHSGDEVVGWPKHWPGDLDDDGNPIEWVFTAAELDEVSAVNIPAVSGTAIDSVRAALSAHLGVRSPAALKQPGRPPKEKTMDPKVLAALGLAADATPEQVATAVNSLKLQKQQAGEALAAQQAVVAQQEAELSALAEAKKAQELDALIKGMYDAGKLAHGPGETPQPDPSEKAFRELGYEQLKNLEPSLPVKVVRPSKTLQSSRVPGGDPTTKPDTATTRLYPQRRKWRRGSQVSPERRPALEAQLMADMAEGAS